MKRRRALPFCRNAGAAIVAALALSACAGTLSPAVEEPPKPQLDMNGRWLLSAPNSPACGMTFREAAGGQEGTIAPEGGCPGNFFTSRHWAFEQGALVIKDHNMAPLAHLSFAGGRFQGKAETGTQITLARSILPSN
jgi:hypothetical protein